MFTTFAKHTTRAAIIGLALLGSSQAYSAALEFDLSGLGNDVPANFAGRDGLFVGPNFNYSTITDSRYNWTFNNDVKLSINQTTGIGTISGTMTGNYDNETWGFSTTLSDLVVRTGTGGSTVRSDYNAGAHDLSALLTSMTAGTGVEWKSLNMTLSNNFGSYSFEGFAMPEMGHINVAELFFRDDYLGSGVEGLVYDAWYKSFATVTKSRWVWKEVEKCRVKNGHKKCWTENKKVKEYYKEPQWVGDTKAYADLIPPSEVPVPAAIWLFAPALAGFTALRRKRSTK